VKQIATHTRLWNLVRRLRQCESGTTLVELGLLIPLYLLIFLGLIDFGRMAFHYVSMEKGMQVAARVATVRPPACSGVPTTNDRGTSTVVPAPSYGTKCSAGAGICANPGTVSCAGSTTNATANEIWTIVQGTFPNSATAANLRFIYTYDNNLGFLGGPYVPVVTMEVQNLDFEFVNPLGVLVGLATSTAATGLGADIPFPALSVTLPGEDLAMGEDG